MDKPESPFHNWRDFLRHIATVSLGLVLALAFEQAVEAYRHWHQVNELHAGLHMDAENNIAQTKRLDDLESQQIKRFGTMADQIRFAAVHKLPVPLPPPVSKGDYDLPDEPAWDAAKIGGTVTLLPPEELKAYAEVSATINNIRESWRARNEVDRRLNACLAQFHTDFNNPAPPDLSTASPEELRTLALLFYEDVAARVRLRRMARELHGAEEAIERGNRKLYEIQAAERTYLK